MLCHCSVGLHCTGVLRGAPSVLRQCSRVLRQCCLGQQCSSLLRGTLYVFLSAPSVHRCSGAPGPVLRVLQDAYFSTQIRKKFAIMLLSFECGFPSLHWLKISTHFHSCVSNDYFLLFNVFPVQTMKKPTNIIMLFFYFATYGT